MGASGRSGDSEHSVRKMGTAFRESRDSTPDVREASRGHPDITQERPDIK